jgi:hypothetical protein
VRRKPVPRRQSTLDRYIVIEERLAAEPHLSAIDVFFPGSKNWLPVGSAAGSCTRSNGWSRIGDQSQPVS